MVAGFWQFQNPRVREKKTLTESTKAQQSRHPTFWKQNPLSQVEYVQRVVQSLPRWFIFVPAAGVKPRNWPLSSLSRVILWNPTPGTNAAAFQPLYKALPLLHSTLNMYLDVCLRERTSCLPFAANWCWYVAASSCHGGCSNSGGQTTEGKHLITMYKFYNLAWNILVLNLLILKQIALLQNVLIRNSPDGIWCRSRSWCTIC